MEIGNRSLRLLGKEISEHDLIAVNKECAQLAHKALTDIDWIKFGLKKTNLDLVLAVPAIILGALFILYICEGIPSVLYSAWYNETPVDFLGESPPPSPIPGVNMAVFVQGTVFIATFIIIIAARSVFSMLISILINKISYFPLNDITHAAHQLYPVPTGRYRMKRLLLISILVMGIPLFVIELRLGDVISIRYWLLECYKFQYWLLDLLPG